MTESFGEQPRASRRLEVWSVIPHVPKNARIDQADTGLARLTYAIKDGRTCQLEGGGEVDPLELLLGEIQGTTMAVTMSAAVLVPVPSSEAGKLGGSARIAVRLAAAGFGSVHEALERTVTVPSSRRAPSNNRTTVAAHINSMRATETLVGEVVLVDDVVTQGSTLVAAREVLLAAGTMGPFRGFVAAHTVGLGDERAMRQRWELRWDGVARASRRDHLGAW